MFLSDLSNTTLYTIHGYRIPRRILRGNPPGFSMRSVITVMILNFRQLFQYKYICHNNIQTYKIAITSNHHGDEGFDLYISQILSVHVKIFRLVLVYIYALIAISWGNHLWANFGVEIFREIFRRIFSAPVELWCSCQQPETNRTL